jgi:hypothetical protein
MADKRLLTDDQRELIKLVEGSDSVEMKLTVPATAGRGAVQALGIDPLDAQIRQVFFFDTPTLDLNDAGVVVRARRIQGRGDDSVVKLRPVVPAELPPEWRKSPNLVVEVDAMPGGFVCSASMKGVPERSVREHVAKGGRNSRLFSKEQRRFFERSAPPGLQLDDLTVLGPIFVLKAKSVPADLGVKVVGELWLYPDGSLIMELSAKSAPEAALRTAVKVADFLRGAGVDLTGEQQTKTKTALQFFADQLAAPNGATPGKAPAKTTGRARARRREPARQ